MNHVELTGQARTETLLITLSGHDRPGVTHTVFEHLAEAGVEVVDLDQIVIRRRLVLGVLVTVPDDEVKLRDAVTQAAGELGMHVEILRGGAEDHRLRHRSQVTIIGAPLKAAVMAEVTGRIAEAGANIDRIQRLAPYPVTAIELAVSGPDVDVLRTTLARAAVDLAVDIAVQPASLLLHGQRLIVMDVDSTLIQGEVIEMLAAHAGCEDSVADVTARAMRGELDFEESLRSRVALLKGVPAAALDDVYERIRLNPGARTLVRTLRRLGYRFAIVSGGFSQITDRLAADLGIHYARANELEIVDGVLTGRVVGEVVDRAGKARALREIAAEMGISEAATVAIGDGANDLDMLEAAGLGVAYNAKPVVRSQADTSVNVPYLDTIMYLLGITREEIEAADADAGIVTPAPPV
ncbi:phosphoserine phosphatase SerB [Nocardioides insulae]|uniref:phosphoserine phosphatase SerB n=1 Tax=Nocardioides insulae TaxID=394734 RepID=UPI0006880692|nr:phosphoserine phosphatase SerB [Nocardioides insulae]